MPISIRSSICVFVLVLLHVTLVSLCFLDLDPSYLSWTFLRIAVGDCELALAMLLAVCTQLRLGLRIAIAAVMIYAAALMHYVAIIPLAYPFVSGEEYFVSFVVAAVLGIGFGYLRWRRGPLYCRQRDNQPIKTHSPNRITLIDLEPISKLNQLSFRA